VHQKGVIKPKEKFNQFIDEFDKILAVVAKEGDWKGE